MLCRWDGVTPAHRLEYFQDFRQPMTDWQFMNRIFVSKNHVLGRVMTSLANGRSYHDHEKLKCRYLSSGHSHSPQNLNLCQ